MLPERYDDIRAETAARDRRFREKVTSLEDAASRVRDGDHVGIGGSVISRTPMALLWQLIKLGRRDLVCSRSMVSTDGDLVFGGGLSRHLVTSWAAQGILWGLSKVVRHHVEVAGATYEEWSHLAMGMRFKAAAAGLPFMPMRSMLGSDLEVQNTAAKRMTCPFTGESLMLVPALSPDVALIHVQRCDPYGNAQIDGFPYMDIDLALAAKSVIITTERIVSNDQIRRTPDQTKIPFFCVDAVVEVPFGAAPHECFGLYEPMMEHLDAYVAQVNASPVEGMRAYLQRHVFEARTWTDFLSLIGPGELIEAGRKGRSVYNV